MSEAGERLDERVLRRILDDEPIGVAICTRVGSDFQYVYVNEAFQALRPDVPMVGRTYRQVWPNLTTPFSTLMQRVLETGEPWVGENVPVESRNDSGQTTTGYYTFNIARLKGEMGLLVLVLARETSLEVRSAEHLRESERRLRQALQAGRSGMFEWDLVSGQVYWSPELVDIYGLGRDGFEGTAEAALRNAHEEDRQRVSDLMAEGLRLGEWEVENRMRRSSALPTKWPRCSCPQ